MSPQIEIIIIASLTAIACALPGVFLVLRRVSLMSDAISHSILLGIVLAFFITKNLTSPLLIIGATIVGVLTVFMTEVLINTQKIKKDAAIGLVFPLLFSIGVILITKYIHDVDLDAQCVLFGEIAFAPFDRLVLFNTDLGPVAMWTIAAVCVINTLFIVLFYKELKIATFDPGLAVTLGLFPAVLNYALMTIVSISAVVAFESVGSILVVALMITPPAAAYLLTERLSLMLILSAFIGFMSALTGYALAYLFDANIAGSMATASGLIFIFVLIFAPERGLIAKTIVRRFKQQDFVNETLAVHLLQAEYAHAEETERVVSHMSEHMLWDSQLATETIAQCIQDGIIKKSGNKLSLTDYGREKAKNILSKE